MTTDNRTNEPSEEQIERALDAISRFNQWTDNPRGAMRAALTAAGVASQEVIDDAADEQDDLRLHMLAPQPVFDEAALAEVIADAPHSGDPNVSCLDPRCKAAAVAAWLREGVAPQEPNQNETKSGNNFVSLDPEKVAAQGAAPQAESEDNVMCRCGHGTGSHDFSDPQEPCREIVCDCRGWFGVSPVLPSSGVDEDKLAEVIGYAYNSEHHDPATHAARAVAEWLKGQER